MAAWRHKVDVSKWFQDDTLSFEDQRDGIVGELSRVLGGQNVVRDVGERTFVLLTDIIQDLTEAEDEDEFNGYWTDLYNWADDNLVWIGTF